jgi:hypothetical protein
VEAVATSPAEIPWDRGIRFEGGAAMHYEFVALNDEQVPQAADPLFQHLVTT